MATVKVVAIGPESTGKSTLVEALAAHYKAPSVSEYARTYLEENNAHPYKLTDLERIARGQLRQTQQALHKNPKVLFCDTDLVTIHIWAKDKFGQIIPFVEENLGKEKADLYLLCNPDLPWVFDPLREDENRRNELFALNEKVLNSLNATVAPISGTGQTRTQNAIQAVDWFLEFLG